jgi:pyrophosphatase PpaX
MKSYEYYLFDADGTLIDTTELIYQCFRYSCKKFGGFDIERERVVGNIGLPLRAQLEVYLGQLSDERAAEVQDAHMKYQMTIYSDHLRLFDTVKTGLDLLKSLKKTLAVVTSRRMKSLELYLNETGIREYFDVLVTPEMTEKHKPDPAPAQKALELLDAQAHESLFIGDAEFDIACGKGAGTDTAFVTWSNNKRSELKTMPTWFIDSLEQLDTAS